MTTEDQSSESRDKSSSSVYLGLGSNLGDREANLREAIERIRRLGLEVIRASSVYETEPVGYTDQPRFLNQVIEVNLDSQFRVSDLLHAVLKIERDMGRERTIPNGPRVIDIDILIYGEVEIADPPQLILPHPRMHERRFVLEPLSEIAPDLTHPRLKKTCRELLAALDND
jgi:2-amino-4-hydroxy-6-hydroxymethyldihydropteridine diphosphokinase